MDLVKPPKPPKSSESDAPTLRNLRRPFRGGGIGGGTVDQARQRIQAAKAAFTAASADVLLNRPNAMQRAEIALRNLTAARADLAALERQQGTEDMHG